MAGAHEYVEQRRRRLSEALQGVSLTALERASGVGRSTLWRIREGRAATATETIDKVEAGLRRLAEEAA